VRPAELPVSEHAIRVWCAAVGETNPIYHDDAAARQAAYSGVVAPGAMLQTWTMPVSHAARQAAPTLHAQIRERACESGYRSVVATDYEQEYLRPIHPGALLTELSWVDAVSPAKQTALGPGRFVTIAFEIRQADGAAVGRVRSRTLYFDPAPRPTRRRPATAPEPLQGERLLVPLRVPLTRSLIVAASLASNDHEPVHHDHESARRDGLPDVIASIVTTAGLVLRYVGERHSRDTRVRRLRLNLAAPAMPGDVLTFRGVGDGTEVVVLADHARGRHVRAELQLGPPGRFAES
jgi:acyl dehydratase